MKTQKLLVALFLLFVISWPSYLFATSGCCSWHDGVCGCDSSVGRQVCCDGTLSPSCTCAYNPPKTITIPKTISIPAKDTTDYKALSSSLQTDLDRCKKSLDESNKTVSDRNASISEKISKITELEKSIETRNEWLWLFGIGLFFSLFSLFYKK